MIFTPSHVTETNTAPPWQDCTWAAGLMNVQKATRGQVPGTRDEREALRRASGDLVGGSSLVDLSRGCLVRYGWPMPQFEGGEGDLKYALGHGGGAVAQGLYSRLPRHFQRWDTAFAAMGAKSGHAAYGQGYRDSDDTLLWFDPLARRAPGGEPWQGERMGWDTFMAFLLGLELTAVQMEGSHVPDIRPEPDPTVPTLGGGDALFNIAPATTHRDAVLKAGTVLYRDSALTRRYSRVDAETPLGFIGSGGSFHVVVNSGNTNYVRRTDVARIEPNERTYT